MAQATELSAAEITFLRRALPHFLVGKSVEDAMRSVLDDDARLSGKLFERTYSVSYGAAGDGAPLVTPDAASSTLSQHLSQTVYAELRA